MKLKFLVIVLTITAIFTGSVFAMPKLQQSAPDISGLEQYAVTDNAKFYYNLLKQYIADEKAIEGRMADPATDPQANSVAKMMISSNNANMKKQVKEGKMDKNLALSIIKAVKESASAPMKFIKNIPVGSEYGYMTFVKGVDSKYVKTVDSYGLTIMYPRSSDPKEIENMVSADIDSFLLKEEKWDKQTQIGKDMYEKAVANAESVIEIDNEIITKLEASNKSENEVRIQQLKKDISEMENVKSLFENKLLQEFPDTISYQYMWQNGKAIDMFVLNIYPSYTYGTSVSFMKMVSK